MTQRTQFDDMACSIARAVDVIGEWWTPLILRDVFVGVNRFDALQADLGISRKVLTQRLNALVDNGVLARVPYQDNPVRHEYVPTEKGAELGAVLLALQAWGDRWAVDEPPVILRHTACGHEGPVAVCCAGCREPMAPHTIELLPGPGIDAAGLARLGARR